MNTNETPEPIAEVLRPSEDAAEQRDALIAAIQLSQSECPCASCVTRTEKRTQYRKRDDVIERRKARAAARAAKRKAEKPAAEKPAPKPKAAKPAAAKPKQTPKQRATSARKADLGGAVAPNE